MSKVAIAQVPAIYHDKQGALSRCCEIIDRAGAQGADIVVFPESWLGGYPAWCFGAADWKTELGDDLYASFVRSSAVVEGPDHDLADVQEAASRNAIAVVLGLNERATASSGTVFNSQVTIDPRGALVNHHRKLTPTSTEKNVWAPGDGSGLRATSLAGGRVGGLICWEHWNPLARQALHAEDEDIHVAAWPDLSEAHQIASRSYAFEGRCFVVVTANILRSNDLPDELVSPFSQGIDAGDDEAMVFDGGSGVIDPWGRWVSGPQWDTEGLIVVDLDLTQIERSRFRSDIAGHYQRPDVFSLTVSRERRPASGVVMSDDADSAGA